jgi:hypothetical protein
MRNVNGTTKKLTKSRPLLMFELEKPFAGE